MVHYFDIREVDAWTEVIHLAACNPPSWIRIAVIEALYQGRYKVVSVQQILDIWQRRGKILSHFNREFEAIVTVPLPDRVQAQLRALAQEHQEEHRQQRLREPARAMIANPEPTAPEVGSTPSSEPTPSIVSPDPAHYSEAEAGKEVSAKEVLVTSLPEDRHPPDQPHQDEENSPRAETEGTEARDAASTDLAASSQSSTPSSNIPAPQTTENQWVPALRRSSSSAQIDRFCPLPDRSGFDRKLLALANQS
jgi:hypothetical protein